MRRREFLSGVVAGLLAVTPAIAQDYVGSIIAQMREQGFQTVRQERTLLGRVRISATRADGRREIIVNPRNGEILRDLWTPQAGGKAMVEIIDDNSDRRDDDDDGDSDDDGADAADNDDDGDEDDGDDDGDDDDSDGGDNDDSSDDDDDDDDSSDDDDDDSSGSDDDDDT